MNVVWDILIASNVRYTAASSIVISQTSTSFLSLQTYFFDSLMHKIKILIYFSCFSAYRIIVSIRVRILSQIPEEILAINIYVKFDFFQRREVIWKTLYRMTSCCLDTVISLSKQIPILLYGRIFCWCYFISFIIFNSRICVKFNPCIGNESFSSRSVKISIVLVSEKF